MGRLGRDMRSHHGGGISLRSQNWRATESYSFNQVSEQYMMRKLDRSTHLQPRTLSSHDKLPLLRLCDSGLESSRPCLEKEQIIPQNLIISSMQQQKTKRAIIIWRTGTEDPLSASLGECVSTACENTSSTTILGRVSSNWWCTGQWLKIDLKSVFFKISTSARKSTALSYRYPE